MTRCLHPPRKPVGPQIEFMEEPFLTSTVERLWPSAREFLREMVGINSFTSNVVGVNRMGEAVAAHFSSLGFVATHVPHGSGEFGRHLVLKRTPVSGAPTVALLAHLDTVFPEDEEQRNEFRWRDEGTRIYGPGTNDIKGGIALIALLLATLREAEPAWWAGVNWVVLCNACEEVDSEDFGRVCRDHLPPDTRACLIFEADGGEGSDFSLVTARNGRATFRVTAHGRGAHAGGGHARGVNAIAQLGRVVADLESLTNYETGLTVNVGRIWGGTVLNRVPELATAELEMRAFSVAVFERAQRHILGWTGPGDLRSRDEAAQPAHVEVTQLDQTPPWPSNEASDALLAHWQKAGAELGISVTTERRGGLSDGNVLWNHFPTLDGLGPRGDHCHCSENDPANGKIQEYVDTTSFVPKVALNITALKALLAAIPQPPP